MDRITAIAVLILFAAQPIYAAGSDDNYISSPFGFHTSAVIPPHEYGIGGPFDYAVDIGVRWERPPVYFVWTAIQPDLSKEEFDWHRYDVLIRLLPDSMNMVANITIGSPGRDRYYGEYAKAMDSFAPKDELAYKRFVMAVVERYDGDGIDDMPGLRRPVKYWQVENEPPHRMRDYAELLMITYRAVKEADAGSKVLIGGVPGMPRRYIEEFDRFYLPILDVLAASKGRYFDIFDFHWYGDAAEDYLGVKKVYEYIKQKVDERGLTPPDGYWITEMGTYSGDPEGIPGLLPDYPYQSEAEQASDMLKRYIYPLSFGIKKVFMAFGLKEGFKDDRGYFDFTGFIYDGKYAYDEGRGVKKLAYYTYKKMTAVLEGSDWSDIKAIRESEGIHIYKFAKAGNNIWVAWNDNRAPAKIVISGVRSRAVRITEAVPKYGSGGEIAGYSNAFNIMTIPPARGEVTLALKNRPVYIEEE